MKTKLYEHQRSIFRLFSAILFVSLVLNALPQKSNAQSNLIHMHFKKKRMNKMDIRFDMIHNLMIVPVFINGSDTMKFILDTGVSHTMITSLKGSYGAAFNYAREINLMGLGNGDEIIAYHSFGNMIEMPGVIGYNHNVIILKDEFDFLSQGLGTQIHGLLGYDVFDSFIVEIDYKSRKMTLYDPDFYERRRRDKMLKKMDVVELEVVRRKPFIYAIVEDEFGNRQDSKLLVDSGASHALTLFTSASEKIEIPDNSIYAFIGIGLSGDIYGHIGRAKAFEIGRYKFKRPLVTFPEEASVQISNYENNRSGSIGADILKRFTVVFDYKRGEMLVKPNGNFKSEFKYNLSGIDLTTPFPDIPVYQVTKIRKGSPAWIAGLEVGDQIVTINGIETSEYSLSNMVQMLQSKAGRTLKVGVKRQEQVFFAKFTLEDPLR
jgi:predicted aspartyl protease